MLTYFKLYTIIANWALKNKGEPATFHISFSSMAYGDDANEMLPYYQTLIDRLSQEGFGFEFLSKLLTDSRAGFIPELTTISLISRETPESYAQFLSPESILLAKKFLL